MKPGERKMDKVALKEQIEIIRRLAERGLSAAHDSESPKDLLDSAIDTFQAILDEVATTKTYLD